MYLRAQKELCELPLHVSIRNELYMSLKQFLKLSEVIWVQFMEKYRIFQDLTALSIGCLTCDLSLIFRNSPFAANFHRI